MPNWHHSSRSIIWSKRAFENQSVETMPPKHKKGNKKSMRPAPCLGVVRLDYDYPAAKGDIDCADTFEYDVYYRAVPGLTFSMCQAGKLEGEVRNRFIECIEWLINEKKVCTITGDCGFMAHYQRIAQTEANKSAPVHIAMSALTQIPAILAGLAPFEHIMIMTANGDNLLAMEKTFVREFGISVKHPRIHVIGCEDVPGFEAVALGEKVNVQEVQPGMVKLVRKKLKEFPKTRAILLECTELPPYANAIREVSMLPVYDAITCCNFYVQAYQEEDRYGKQGWQDEWDGVQEEYVFGDNVPEHLQSALVNKPGEDED